MIEFLIDFDYSNKYPIEKDKIFLSKKELNIMFYNKISKYFISILNCITSFCAFILKYAANCAIIEYGYPFNTTISDSRNSAFLARGDPTLNPLPLRRGGAMWHADLPHLPCLLAKMWCVRGIIIKENNRSMTITLSFVCPLQVSKR